MKTNEVLQKDVQDAIKWEPLLNAAEIGVTAKDGIITLTGTVNSFMKKMEAEDAAKKVKGVKAVVENIDIKLSNNSKASDNEIANDVVNAFKWDIEIPGDDVKVKVEDGWVTLSGNIKWNYQREAAKKAVSKLCGVKGVIINIKIESETDDEINKKNIESALDRNWTINGIDIHVEIAGHKVILKGIVDSWYQKEEAGRIAWNAPGVWEVDNEILIDYITRLSRNSLM